jgi:hypothetical protein
VIPSLSLRAPGGPQLSVSTSLTDGLAAARRSWGIIAAYGFLAPLLLLLVWFVGSSIGITEPWLTILWTLLLFPFGVGLSVVALKSIRRQRHTVEDLVPETGILIRSAIVFSLLFVALCLGLILLVLPGIVLGLRWSQACWLIVDRRAGVFASFQQSAALTDGARWRICQIALVWSLLQLPHRVAAILPLDGSGSYVLMVSLLALFGLILSIAGVAITPFVAAAMYEQLVSWPQRREVDERNTLLCPHCESPYRLSDYRDDVAVIRCSACKQPLPPAPARSSEAPVCS